MKARTLNRQGQSSIEFVLSFLLLLGFLLFFFQLSMMMAFGNYVHYATFMAARAYLSSGPDASDQSARAKEALVQLVKIPGQPGRDRFPMIGKGFGGGSDLVGAEIGPLDKFQPQSRSFSWMEGVRYSFKGKLFSTPFSVASGRGNPDANSLILVSESFLGREPSVQECSALMEGNGWSYDNGC